MMKDKRKFCVVTGSRADYGLLYWLLKNIEEDTEIELQLIVTGMHLSSQFGYTYKNIENDGFKISEKIEMLLDSEKQSGIVKSMGIAMIGFADAFDRLKPNMLIVLGDRYEIFSAAQAAAVLNIPIAHIHGGETTEGAIDESFRHSITKMSHLHFVATEEYRKRVIQLGESPERVFNFGSPGLDNIHKIEFLSKEILQEQLGLNFGKINFLVTYHPVTLYSFEQLENSINNILNSLSKFSDANLYFTASNSDAYGTFINKKIQEFTKLNYKNSIFHISLGQQKYLSLLKYIDVVIGNSSSALIEVAALKIPAVNIGPRQNGRIKSSSVIDCNDTSNEIEIAIHKGLDQNFRKSLEFGNYPYGDGKNNSLRIYEKIKEYPIENILFKKFNDILG